MSPVPTCRVATNLFAEEIAMTSSRRTFLQRSGAALAASAGITLWDDHAADASVTKAALDRVLDEPVLKTDFLKEPVTVASVELLRNGRNYLLRTRSTAGVEVITVPNPERMTQTFPIFLRNIV